MTFSPLPFRGGDRGGGLPHSLHRVDGPHPNPSPEGEGLFGLQERLYDQRQARFPHGPWHRLSGV
ncbi:hypothetical protein SxD43FB_13100 [Sphingobium sp. D43FB]|nr:hypothetical protein SxD43FB_13100 [Sphingobium sp. D43FB]